MPVQSTKHDDRKLRAISAALRKVAAQVVDVGAQGPRGGPSARYVPRPNQDGSRPPSPGSVAQVLSYHELSRGRRGFSPRRSVIAATLADTSTRAHIVKLEKQVVAQTIATGKPAPIDVIGKYAIEQMRRRIMSRIAPALGPWAVKAAGLVPAKGGKFRRKRGLNAAALRDKRLIPLLDTRQIYKSLRYHRHTKGGAAP